ncbi:adenosine deaminase [Stigmatella aurantiaca]|uniref:adenosine deaminase n=1 Tax=Stigmatella aurantiaca (strain DW4/3-1) TaxID=378806 RepID=Q096I6_STIAD|nr:adenosine deaminase [Stigmatella aurantiaca]ADO68730.1 Adenosine deaminase [Stigmatella aurantiaca DW4/3-1]EAU67680.1 adenosine deaminase [Stigmatella aurantiaca DW4/3-1]
MTKLPLAVAVGVLCLASCGEDPSPPETVDRETRVDGHMESLRTNSAALEAFLREMPKGGDLHSHTSGAITTEKLIQWGAEDGACVDTSTYVASNPCANNTVPLANAMSDSAFYSQVLGAWSMEGFSGPLLDAHQHFFDAFGKYGAVQTAARGDDIFADVLSTAGHNRQIYVELMQGFGAGTGGNIAMRLFTPADPWDAATLLAKREQIIHDPAFRPAIEAQAASIAGFLSGARQLMGCGTATPDPGCDVEVRLIASANRTADRASVFGQWVYAYELAQVVPEMVGINLVSPEENPKSLAFYSDEMFALGTLDDFNDSQPGRKTVHISLHAGELIPEVLPPEAQGHLTFHIREAVEKAHAERIGHSVDIMRETAGDGAEDLLRDMHEAGVMVEICLTSNRVLLGVSGTQHPLSNYLEQQVPVTLATDDQGILRGSITEEYVAAATDQRLDYKTLKYMARVSLQHAFVEGESLWTDRTAYGKPVSDCAQDALGAAQVSAACERYLTAHKKAALQWKLEGQLAAFEDGILQ